MDGVVERGGLGLRAWHSEAKLMFGSGLRSAKVTVRVRARVRARVKG